MRLLLDENLSPRLAPAVAHLFDAVTHVRDVGLQSADDAVIWRRAADHGFTIVTKDMDFNQRAFLLGPPPKVVWISCGNCSTDDVISLLRRHHEELLAFERSASAAVLRLS